MLAGDEVWYYAENDFYMNNETSFRVAKGLQNSASPYLNYWEGGRGAPKSLFVAIRDCNIFLENLVAVPGLEEQERLRWLDEVKVLKAFYHFWLMQMYGPIPIIKTNVPSIGFSFLLKCIEGFFPISLLCAIKSSMRVELQTRH